MGKSSEKLNGASCLTCPATQDSLRNVSIRQFQSKPRSRPIYRSVRQENLSYRKILADRMETFPYFVPLYKSRHLERLLLVVKHDECHVCITRYREANGLGRGSAASQEGSF
jgi:hypothetical protein